MRLQNLHTHTVYCDGLDQPETLVRRAIELGFSSLGFSGHIDMPVFMECNMDPKRCAAYKAELARLSQKYKDVLQIYVGVEDDLYSEEPTADYDYVIGSVHCIKKDGRLLVCDDTFAELEHDFYTYFDGDGYAYAKAYYESVMLMSETHTFDFVGHFDLLTKFRDAIDFFDTSSERYRRLAKEALHVVKEKHDIFEINTGAISRGYRKTPYPDLFLLREMKEIGAHVIVTSDCHDARFLDCHFAECYAMMRECGFQTTLYRTKDGWEEQSIADAYLA